MTGKRLLAYFGHHKCGSTWISSILTEVSNFLGLKDGVVHDEHMFNYDLNNFVKKNNILFISYTNASIKYIENLPKFRGFHVVRDPRDIVVSAYYSHLYSHPTDRSEKLAVLKEKLKVVTASEGLLLEMDFLKNVLTQMETWDYEASNILEIKMEEMIGNPYESFMDIFNFLGIHCKKEGFINYSNFLFKKAFNKVNRNLFPGYLFNPPPEKLLQIIHRNRFSQKSGGRKRGQEDIQNHYRKGIAGDWKNHFEKKHIDYFKERYNNLLIQLGYENSLNW